MGLRWHMLWVLTALGFLALPHASSDAARLDAAPAAAPEDKPVSPVAQAALTGQIVADPANPRWLKIQGGAPFFLAGPGDPEGFLYRGTRNANGSRAGDQLDLINKMKSTGANALYVQVIRSNGGDGDASQNPFVDSNPAAGLDNDILDQWEQWLTALDNAGVATLFFFYDDSASIWETGDSVGTSERAFLEGIVNRFEHHPMLMWAIAEEYQERFSAARVKNIAAVIRQADDHDHIIAVHKLDGLDFSEFADDANIDQFAIQYNVDAAAQLHSGMLSAWSSAAGKYNLNMSEAANHGTGASARQKDWAVAMGGAYVMRLGMDIATSSTSDLEDCGRLVRFMKSTTFADMAPHDELGYGGTQYVLADPGKSYIAYASASTGTLGLRNLNASNYYLRFFDPVTGATVEQTNVALTAGDHTFNKPASFGGEVALYVKLLGAAQNVPPTATAKSVVAPKSGSLEITLDYVDADGPGPTTFAITTQPAHGTLSGTGGTRTYTPTADYVGTDSFGFTVNDGVATSAAAQVQIEVSAGMTPDAGTSADADKGDEPGGGISGDTLRGGCAVAGHGTKAPAWLCFGLVGLLGQRLWRKRRRYRPKM